MKQRKPKATTRYGRFRRWLVRPAIWLLVAFSVAFFGLVVYLGSDSFAERTRRAAAARLSRVLGREVRVGGLEFEWMPPRIEVSDLTIGGDSVESPNSLELERGVFDLRVEMFSTVDGLARSFFPRLTIDHAVLERPVVRIGFGADGRHDLPRIDGRRSVALSGSSDRWFEFRIGLLDVVDGWLELETERVPVGFVARDLRAQFRGVNDVNDGGEAGEGLALTGSASAAEVRLQLARMSPDRPGRPDQHDQPDQAWMGSVAIEGTLRSDRFDIDALKVESRDQATGADSPRRSEQPALAVEGAGFLRFRGGRELALDLTAKGDLGVLHELGYLQTESGSQSLAGGFEFAGKLASQPGDWRLEGDVGVPRARIFGRDLSDLAARVEADRNRLVVRTRRAEYGGGSVSGDVSIGLTASRGRVNVDLDLAQISLRRLLTDQSLPIHGLGGAVSGNFNYQFDSGRPRSGNGWSDLVVTDEVEPDLGELQLAGTVPLVIGDGVIRTEAARLAGASQILLGEGEYDLKTSRGSYHLELSTDRLEEIVELLPEDAQDAQDAQGAVTALVAEEGTEDGVSLAELWRPTSGRGTVFAELSIDGPRTAVATQFTLSEVVAPGFEADELKGKLKLDSAGLRDLRIELLRPDGGLIVTGSVPFAPGETAASELPFELTIDAAGWPLEQARPWLAFPLPLEGSYTGSLELAGALTKPIGGFRGRLEPARMGRLKGEFMEVVARLTPDDLLIESASLGVSGGTIEVRGGLARESLETSLEFSSSPLDLAQGQLAERLGVSLVGNLVLSGRLWGPPSEPSVDAQLVWSGLAPPDGGDQASAHPPSAPESATLEVRLREGAVEVEGSLLGLANVAGMGQLGTDSFDLSLAVDAGRLDRLVGLWPGLEALPVADIGGVMAGVIEVEGRFGEEPTIAARATLDRLVLELGPVDPGSGTADGVGRVLPRLVNLEPVEIALDPGAVRIESLYLGEESSESEFFVAGSVGIAENTTLDLNLQTWLGSEWLGLVLSSAWPQARLRGGSFSAIASLGGDRAKPQLSGVGELTAAQLVSPELPTTAENLSATILIYPDQVVIDRATVQVAGGSARATGAIDWPLSGQKPKYRFQLSGERLSYRSELGWLLRGGTAVTLSSTEDGRVLTGNVDLDRAIYLTDVKLGLEQLLSALFERRRLAADTADQLLASTQLNLIVTGDDSVRVRNNLADVTGTADLVLRGSLARPVVFGRIEFEPGGRLVYSGSRYEVERASLEFTNPFRIEPVVDLVARTRLREYDVTLNLSGTLDRLHIDLASNPPLADLEVLALLTGSAERPVSGSARSAAAEFGNDGGASGASSVGAEGFLYGQASSLVAQRFNRLFGLDSFRIDPLTSSTGDLSSARVTVGKQLSRDLSATYSYDPSTTEEQVLELEWSVSRSLVLVLTQNGDGTYALDARWEKVL